VRNTVGGSSREARWETARAKQGGRQLARSTMGGSSCETRWETGRTNTIRRLTAETKKKGDRHHLSVSLLIVIRYSRKRATARRGRGPGQGDLPEEGYCPSGSGSRSRGPAGRGLLPVGVGVPVKGTCRKGITARRNRGRQDLPEEGYRPSGSRSRGPAGRALLLVGALVVRTCLRSLRTGLRALRSLLGCALRLVHLLEGLAQCL